MSKELETAIQAAKEAGAALRSHFYGQERTVDETLHHDLKLELDRQTQAMIEQRLLSAFPDDALYGEEGLAGNQQSQRQWIVDPIDGTVNFYYEIPHFCVSIAHRVNGVTQTGVIYDPMANELWTVQKGSKPKLNGREVAVSNRTTMHEAVLFVGCGKDEEALKIGLERFRKGSLLARKMRMMGSAALGMAYIACGRLDGYIESRISLWDVAAGQLMVEEGGGTVHLTPNSEKPDVYSIVAGNGKVPLEQIL